MNKIIFDYCVRTFGNGSKKLSMGWIPKTSCCVGSSMYTGSMLYSFKESDGQSGGDTI